MPTNLQELWNENSHRRYPLQDSAPAKDTTGTVTIPDSLIVDLQLCVPLSSTGAGVFYISSVTIKRLTIDVGLSYRYNTGTIIAIGSFFNIIVGAGTDQTYTFSPLEQTNITYVLFSDISGSIVIGSTTAASSLAGQWLFTYLATPINVSSLNEGLTQVRSIQVDSERFTGNVVLREGDNINIVPTYDVLTGITTLTINSSLPAGGTVSLLSDSDVLTALEDKYGKPITTINNLRPDSGGNFEFEGQDCVEINTGTGVQISNPCSQPCCDNVTTLDEAYQALNKLNLKYGQIYDFYVSVSSRISELQSKIAILENQTGFF